MLSLLPETLPAWFWLLCITLWLKDGALKLNGSGALYDCASCPCNVPASCSKCDISPDTVRYYQTVDFTGVTNLTGSPPCTECNDWNTTAWELPQYGGGTGCTWFIDDDAGLGGVLPCAAQGTNHLELRLSNAGGAAQNTRVIVEVTDAEAFFFQGAVFDETRLNSANGMDGRIDCANLGAVAFSLQTSPHCEWSAATVSVSGHS